MLLFPPTLETDVAMSWTSRYALALLPPAVLFGVWRLGVYSLTHFHCEGSLKQQVHCATAPFDLMPWLVASLFWSPVLLVIVLPIAAFLLIDTAARHIGSTRGAG